MMFLYAASVHIQWPTPEITAIFTDPGLSNSNCISHGAEITKYLVLIDKHVRGMDTCVVYSRGDFNIDSMIFITKIYRTCLIGYGPTP